MTILHNFKIYTPEEPEKVKLAEDLNALFLKCDEGYDWYECQSLFEKDKPKVMYDSNGVINSVTNDVSGFFPENSSVADVDYLPEGFDIFGNFMYDEKTNKVIERVYSDEEMKTIVQKQLKFKMQEVSETIQPLQYAEEMDMITEEEKSKLIELKKYSVMLSRVPTQKGYPSKIDWPQKPA